MPGKSEQKGRDKIQLQVLKLACGSGLAWWGIPH
jgi:hypothetical protein